jgi:NADH dehydrogenase
MKPKNCLIFGASGLIGRHLIRKLTQNNFKVTAVTRNIHRKGYILKTQGNPGYINIVESSIFDENKIRVLLKKTDICINLVGILYEKGKLNTFKNIHEKFPNFLSNLCREYNVQQFIHLSALGIENAKDSLYAKSKLEGEALIRNNFKEANILRPSVIYSVDDNFTTNFMTLLNLSPIFPIYYKGATLFRPIYISDLIEIIYQIIDKNIKSETIECIGLEEISLKDILKKLLKLIGKKRILLPLPLVVAQITAFFFQMFPKPLITIDQLKLLKYSSIPSGKNKTNFDIKIPSFANFENEVKKYSYMWRQGGEFTKIKEEENN